MKVYQASRPWVYKIRVGEKLANDLFFISTMVGQQPFQLRKDGLPCVLLRV